MKAYTYINKGEFALIDKPKPTIIELAGQAADEDHDLLTEACRAGGLSVGAGEHRYVRPLVGELLKAGDEGLYLRDEDLVEGVFDGEGN